jgi:hypothetical protein
VSLEVEFESKEWQTLQSIIKILLFKHSFFNKIFYLKLE